MNELEVLNFYNRWWVTEKVPEELLQKFRRDAFVTLKNELPFKDYSRIVSLVGPRQTGKTTLLYQLIQTLLEKKINSKRILFLSLSDLLFVGNQLFLEKCFEVYEKEILQESLADLGEPIYIFLDEIQYKDKWELWLKRYYDLGYKIKFVISGSASSKLLHKGRESLAGRISEKFLYPFSFKEYVGFNRSQKEVKWADPIYSFVDTTFLYSIKRPYQELREYRSFEAFGRRFMEKKAEVLARQPQALPQLAQFIERGGFPGVYRYSDLSLSYRYLNQDVLDRVTSQDIPQIAQVRDVRLLQTLLLTVAARSGSIFSYRNLAIESGARSETIRSYLTYLNSAFLIFESWQFRKSEMAKLKADKKFYLCDVGLRHALLKYSQEKIFSDEQRGAEAETLVANHLRQAGWPFSFWRRDDFEVDFIVDQFDFVFPIEVKYRKNIRGDDLKGVKKFMVKYNMSGGVIVTETQFDYKDGLVFIPLWLFLLISS